MRRWVVVTRKHPSLRDRLASIIRGEVYTDRATRQTYSHDASLFEVKPAAIVFPRDSRDIQNLVRYVKAHKHEQPELSLTARSAGTDMSGGAINDSIIVGFEKHFTSIGPIEDHAVRVEPGVFYRDLEKATLASGLILPTYPASRELCMIGGMVANDAGGEKSLRYGKTHAYVQSVNIVLDDGKEHTIRPLSSNELLQKLSQQDYEGRLYRAVHTLMEENRQLIDRSKPRVSKNSTGYNVWDVWDGHTFDMTRLLVGSQGTLGLITSVKFNLVPAKPLSGMVVAFLPSLSPLGDIIKAILPLKPTSLESFDEHTLKFALRFFLSFRKTLGWKRFIFLGLSFIPLLNKLLRYIPHLPKLILLIEFEGSKQEHIEEKLSQTMERLNKFEIESHIAADKQHEEKFWIMRRESFNLLRKNVKRKHTAPFIDDLIVPPECLPDFLPRLTDILERYRLLYTVAGHMGDGNFHIIPLMDLTDAAERAKIPAVLHEVTALVLEYGGSLSGEHNDGLIRGPFLEQMYGKEMLDVFKRIKHIFDPHGIFNPHKKTDATLPYSESHIRRKF